MMNNLSEQCEILVSTFQPDAIMSSSVLEEQLWQNYDDAGWLHAHHALGTARIHSIHSRPAFL